MPSEHFTTRCKSLYDSQRNRSKQKKNKNGRITKKGWIVPFSQQQFNQWFIQKFGGAEGGVARCPYCKTPIDAYSCVIDHMVPLKRGGSPGLENLAACCEPCNSLKSQMTPEELAWFLDKMREMSIAFLGSPCVSDITSRMRKAVSLAASVHWSRSKRDKGTPQVAPTAVVEDDF